MFLVSNNIFVIKHTWRDPLLEQRLQLFTLFFFPFHVGSGLVFFIFFFFPFHIRFLDLVAIFFSIPCHSVFGFSLFLFLFPPLSFRLSHLRPIKKKSTIGATNWLLWVCEFSGCFKDANEFFGFVFQAQNRSGCCGYWGLKEKKKGMPGFGRSSQVRVAPSHKWCRR